MTLGATAQPGPRRLPLAGAVNFRDLGGYPTADGRTIAWRRLFRSDSLAELTEQDRLALEALGLRRIFDLRSTEERRLKPGRAPISDEAGRHEPGFYLNQTEKLLEILHSEKTSPDQVIELMIASYRQAFIADLPFFREAIALFLEADDFPAVVHCTSGKDRTGLFVLIVLTMLGVPRDIILEDYLLTNLYQRDISFMLRPGANLFAIRAAKSARRAFLAAAFGAIDHFWGGDDAFFAGGAGAERRAIAGGARRVDARVTPPRPRNHQRRKRRKARPLATAADRFFTSSLP